MNAKTILKLFASLLAFAFGVFMIYFGEIDDSPGAMLIGVVLIAGGVEFFVRRAVRRSKD